MPQETCRQFLEIPYLGINVRGGSDITANIAVLDP